MSKSAQEMDSNERGANNIKREMGYTDFNRFVVTINKEDSQDPVRFILDREGLLSWKVKEIQLPI